VLGRKGNGEGKKVEGWEGEGRRKLSGERMKEGVNGEGE
jgi:hypothetical protein